MNTDPNLFAELGYVVLPRVFSSEEIADFRAAAIEDASHAGDVLSHPTLTSVVTDNRLLLALRSIGIWPARYFGDSSVSQEPGGYGFHRDNADRFDGQAPDWCVEDYPLVRMAIYLQDYSSFGGGLEVIPRSHCSCAGPFESPVYLSTAPGDLVIWNLRVLHTGYGGQHLPLQPAARIALFLTYARPCAATTRYIAFLKTRTYQMEIWRHSVYRDQDVLHAAQRGLLVRDLRADLQGVPGLGQHSGYAPLPYVL